MAKFSVFVGTVKIVCVADFSDETVIQDTPHLRRVFNEYIDSLEDSLPEGYIVEVSI